MSTSPLPPPALAAWPDDALAALLRARPDLASPLPSSLTALTARAATPRSVQLAVASLDVPHLAALDAVLALSALGVDGDGDGEHVDGLVDVPGDAVRSATGLDLDAQLDHLAALALLEPGWRPAPGVAAARPRPANLAVAVPPVSAEPLPDLSALTPGARRVLDALTWGPPVGTFGDDAGGGLTAAVTELLESALVRRTADGGVVLPGLTALAMRGGRTHRGLTPTAPTSPSPSSESSAVVAVVLVVTVAVVGRRDDLAPGGRGGVGTGRPGPAPVPRRPARPVGVGPSGRAALGRNRGAGDPPHLGRHGGR